jgi:uncharacterized membrane protein
MPTDKTILTKGLKYMGWALPMFFIGPVLVFNSFQNKKSLLYIPVLCIAVIVCFLAIYFAFKGLKTIMRSMTD